LTKPDHILLVIAHPDDEAMFFVPTIHTLVQEVHSNVYILCLSTGNFDGLGSVRTEELYASAKVLNVAKTNVKIINDPTLQDGKQQVWSKEDVAKQVGACVDRWPINKIITFDDYGVSGHENHRDTSRGVVYFYETSKWGRTNGGSGGGGGGGGGSDDSGGGGRGDSSTGNNNENNLYVLESTHLCRKYTGVLDVLTSLVQDGSQCFCSLTPWINYAAMQAHFSQFVWYRRLFVLFSRYTYVNNLIKQHRPVVAKKESGAEELNKGTKKTK